MNHSSTAGVQALHAELMRGRLDVTIRRASVEPSLLFGFAERRNPKRAFLFVSKVLGRHIPVRPSVMSDSFNRLAAQIPADLPGPVLVIGMAETAVGLGAGVHRALSQTRPDTVYIVSTRHPVGTEVFARFEEEHSHASAHLIHLPIDPGTREMMLNARSLVLVDDEASTGKTFINLHRALIDAGLSQIERVVAATLTDWSAGAVTQSMGRRASQVSLLEGSYTFSTNPDAALPEMPEVGTVAVGDWPIHADRDWGRLGVSKDQDSLGTAISVKPGERVLVVGNSEFVWRPFLLAERLERAGAEVYFSSTSRSPIAMGHSIQHALSFSDSYGLGIPNFLYNVAPGQFDRVLICSETPAEAVDRTLVQALNAEVVVDGQ
ncbi:phosphoribosyltransferase domain-containing protein [Stutzerimonas stutzeri]|uniref:phosphoribosyltransferase domain-containing protein n=1 Tax=Stutzerimonas stutzeri TaxID=316 RepID=UPI00210D5ABE|nr:phosphoribosyltransferase domain-containing protein [Stutzerimonas stutzeri]MCQ4319023.1 phosphoribosyltransferase family protein [Stutzerimonas stutzeri]